MPSEDIAISVLVSHCICGRAWHCHLHDQQRGPFPCTWKQELDLSYHPAYQCLRPVRKSRPLSGRWRPCIVAQFYTPRCLPDPVIRKRVQFSARRLQPVVWKDWTSSKENRRSFLRWVRRWRTSWRECFPNGEIRASPALSPMRETS